MEKSKSVIYVTRMITTTPRSELYNLIKDFPLKRSEINFLIDIVEGLSYKELAIKYSKSTSRIGKWKREICDKVQKFQMRKIMH